ncbi:MAG: metallophosphoesterase [Myxococcales bacterium]|nr:metallophosphoesterase [Myxococcales bacterium]
MPQWLRVAVFLTVFALLIVGTHAYLYRRLVRDVFTDRRRRRLGLALFVGAGAVMLGGAVVSRMLPRAVGEWVALAAYGWMGMVVLLLPITVVVDAVRWALLRWGRDEAPRDPGRRLALARGAAAVTAFGATGAGAVGVKTCADPPTLRDIEVPVRGLPPALDGFTIAQLTDIHVGPIIGAPFTRQLVERVNALDVDLVAITGDLVDGSVARLRDHVAPLGGLKSRHGTYFVTGNHEYYSGADAWIAELRRLGITVLRNERITVEHDGAPLDVLGVDDWRSKGFGGDHGHDLQKAAHGRDPTRPSLLLAHQPKVIDEAASLGLNVVLCGHTHGGQMWPFGSIVVAMVQPYVVGLHQHAPDTWIYVHPGTGYWGPPMRLKVRAEIARITLRAVLEPDQGQA